MRSSDRLQAGRAILEAVHDILLFISDRLNGSVLTVEESVMIAFIKIYNKISPPIFENKLNATIGNAIATKYKLYVLQQFIIIYSI